MKGSEKWYREVKKMVKGRGKKMLNGGEKVLKRSKKKKKNAEGKVTPQGHCRKL